MDTDGSVVLLQNKFKLVKWKDSLYVKGSVNGKEGWYINPLKLPRRAEPMVATANWMITWNVKEGFVVTNGKIRVKRNGSITDWAYQLHDDGTTWYRSKLTNGWVRKTINEDESCSGTIAEEPPVIPNVEAFVGDGQKKLDNKPFFVGGWFCKVTTCEDRCALVIRQAPPIELTEITELDELVRTFVCPTFAGHVEPIFVEDETKVVEKKESKVVEKRKENEEDSEEYLSDE